MNYVVDLDYVVDLVKNYELFSSQYALVDIRSYEEYIGETSGYGELKTKVIFMVTKLTCTLFNLILLKGTNSG